MEESRYQGVPQFVYGTAFKEDQTGILTEKALTHGFVGVDSAAISRNYKEELAGEGIRQAVANLQLKREQIFIQTKFTPYQEGKDPKFFSYDTTADFETQVDQSIASSLKNLHVPEDGGPPKAPYLDNLTLHSPYPAFDDTLRVWKAMEKYVPHQITTLGISNVHPSTLMELYEKATVKPALVQNRFTPDTDQTLPPFTPKVPYDIDVRRFCQEHQIVYQPWGVLWGTCFLDTPTLLQNEVVAAVSRELEVSLEMAVYLLVMELSPGEVSILNGTKNEEHMQAAFDGLKKFKEWVDGEGNAVTWAHYMNELRKTVGA